MCSSVISMGAVVGGAAVDLGAGLAGAGVVVIERTYAVQGRGEGHRLQVGMVEVGSLYRFGRNPGKSRRKRCLLF